jgi:CheY-like chemotaxis protein
MACILFVDDDPLTLEMMEKAMGLFGHQTLSASSGKEALELARDRAPDLIFVDMRLPDTNGLALVASLQSSPATAKTPTYILSAAAEADMEEQALAAGARAFLRKPISLTRLVDLINATTANP